MLPEKLRPGLLANEVRRELLETARRLGIMSDYASLRLFKEIALYLGETPDELMTEIDKEYRDHLVSDYDEPWGTE